MHVAHQIKRLARHEQQRQTEAAKNFEVYPDCGIDKGNEEIGEAADEKEHDPGDIELRPLRCRQSDGMAHHPLDQRLIADEVATGKRQREQPIQYGRFPLEDRFAVQYQGQPAEQQASRQRQPLAFFKPALMHEQNAVDHDGADDQHRCCVEYATDA